MLRPKSIALVNQRRTLRALYAQTQAYPYAANLSGTNATGTDTFTNFVPTGTESQDQLPLSDGSTGVGIFPGAVLTMVNTTTSGEKVALADAVTQRPFGLSANFVGGNMDELNGRSEIGVWRGRGGVFEVLAPVFGSTITGTDDLVTDVTPDAIGRLVDGDVVDDSSASTVFGVARPINFLSERALIIELTVGG